MEAIAAPRLACAERNGPWIQTSMGRKYWPFDPRPEDIHFDDLANALSKLCRFNGHCREFYSVAQHSVLVSQLVVSQFAMAALLHDASEAFLADIVAPLKRSREFASYRELEDRNIAAIYARFGVPFSTIPPEVKRAERVALATEKRDLMRPMPWDDELPAAAPDLIIPLEPHQARGLFWNRFLELGGEDRRHRV